jgi:site-specific recombinase XerD
MSDLAPTLQSFFTERLARQRQASPRTIAAYRDAFRLLLAWMETQTGIKPSQVGWTDLDASTISAFLDHLEHDRGNSARTRNTRLTAIRSLFHYAALEHPEHAAIIQRVLAIPAKRFDKATVSWLHQHEADALIAAPDRATWEGRRDHTMLLIAVQTGLRVSELIGLNCGDVTLDTGAHVRCEGKGRKLRAVPMTSATAAVVRVWLQERRGGPDDPLLVTRTGRRLSRDAIEQRVTKHAATAADNCPTLRTKHLTPHVLRHTCAMSLLQAGVDTSVIALWLGHADPRSTNAYLHADLTIKQQALEQASPTSAIPGRYRPPDALLAFLEDL